jgi:hypothetical protein
VLNTTNEYSSGDICGSGGPELPAPLSGFDVAADSAK